MAWMGHPPSHSDFSFFVRASQHKHFLRLAAITGISDADALREAALTGYERLMPGTNYHYRLGLGFFWERMNMEKLDSLK
jgi:hypothetical protein